jgi:TatD DNase family protein
MKLIDTHCHMHFEQYGLDTDEVLAAAAVNGVDKIICVGTTLADSQSAVSFAAAHDNVWATAGVHPHDAAVYLKTTGSDAMLSEFLGMKKVVAVGEIGLDYYHSKTPKDEQQKALYRQIEAGRKFNLPFVFHVREAFDDFWPIFDSYENLRGVIHSFSAGTMQLDQILSRGLLISLNGIMTFTKDEVQLQAAKDVPLDRLMLETDAPFLTPAPYRGQISEPKYILDIAKFLAELRGEKIEDLATATTKNAEALFKLETQ